MTGRELSRQSPIVGYYHCRTCLDAGGSDRIAVGFTINGLVVVWCDGA